jgi:hypothetical protein
MKYLMMLILTGSFPLAAMAGPEVDWNAEAKNITRLSPLDFTEVPEPIRKALDKEGCAIPQTMLSPRHNVVHGEFVQKGQVDWVALCSKQGASSLFFIWGGKATCPNRIGASDDKDFLQGVRDEKVAFSRRIDAISKEGLKYKYDRRPAKAPKDMDHDALRDAFLEKASSILYCSNNKWVPRGGDD